MEVGWQSDGTAEEEDGVEDINGDHDDRVDGEALLDCRSDEVEE